ncbi:MAG: ornithine carbamoyltransferase [Nevskiaceae bacterium]|nr:MAG: ornithine carbamoyltransferase [Nevskiaceae bacterium]TBR71755.1 MAG: ornithine carbamoyltransferase [Nevskiaceae bacterium]
MNAPAPRHFLKLSAATPAEAHALVARAAALKAADDRSYRPLTGHSLAMIFAKNSTRTRTSFDAGMARFGGNAIMLPVAQTQLGRNEPLADTARVLSRYCSAIMIRNDSQADQEELARHSRVPVINALSDLHHPCQVLADLQTWYEQRGAMAGKTAAWIGDGNNVCNSWIEAARLFGFKLNVACPQGYEPDAATCAWAGSAAQVGRDPQAAVQGAEVVVTDTWTSMGQEGETDTRLQHFNGFQVDDALMTQAAVGALFMHCLPAHRGEEVAPSVIDGPHSVVWDEAGNRMWAQMALLEWLIVGPR